MSKGQLFQPAHLRLDVIAGLTAAAVVLPKALAYATVARLPVAVGLYTAFVPLLMYALLGTSRVLSVTSTATLAILTGTELEAIVTAGEPDRLIAAAATLSVLTGVFLVIASVARLGFVANFISTPVLVGFKAGIGCVILLDQAPKLLGLHLTKQDFFHDLIQLFAQLPKTSLTTLAVGAGTLVGVLLLKRYTPQLPAPLLAVAGGIGASWYLQLEAVGVEVVGSIPDGLPSVTWPDLSLTGALVPGALGIALMSFAESIAAARAFSVASDPPLRPNRELWATGMSNLAGGLLGGMPAGGGTSQTAVTRAAGASTQQASIVVALVSLGTMLFLGPVLGRMPQATLAAVVIVYSVSLIQPKEFAAIRRVRRMEF
ncbi:MAG TPA: SulP family inorganic anion transporter, partial [Polyangiaceae bacterium]|nr:SulP family inorganic anion transporter [Polyangiaceae bacterium]